MILLALPERAQLRLKRYRDGAARPVHLESGADEEDPNGHVLRCSMKLIVVPKKAASDMESAVVRQFVNSGMKAVLGFVNNNS